MSTRISEALGFAALLSLASCGSPGAPDTRAPGQAAKSAAAGNLRIACARQGATLADVCTVDRTPTQDGVILTVRHPDGGFRRLRITGDGRGVVAADGSQQATVGIVGPREIEVTLAGDRYRLPATLGTPPSGSP
jgi:hypothetical protein